PGAALFGRLRDDLVVDVGDVADEGDVEAAVLEPAAHDVEVQPRADVPDVGRRLHGGTTQVDRDATRLERGEVTDLPGAGVVQANSHHSRVVGPGECVCLHRRAAPGGCPAGRPGPVRARRGPGPRCGGQVSRPPSAYRAGRTGGRTDGRTGAGTLRLRPDTAAGRGGRAPRALPLPPAGRAPRALPLTPAGRQPVVTTSAVATAMRPSPRPGKPRPSVVAPDTVTGAPAASERTFCASSRRLPIRGRGPTTCTATLPMRNPASRAIRAASVSRATPEAPDHSGRPVPKCCPRSPRPAAENRALQAACATTSASECPARPGPSPSHLSPAHHSSRPSSKAWMSVPMPTRGSGGSGSEAIVEPPAGQDRLGEDQVQRAGHLERLLVPGHGDDGQPELLDHARVV